MRLLVCGSRDWDSPNMMVAVLEDLYRLCDFRVLIHGDARGADRMGASWGESRGIRVIPYLADWQKYGRAAGPIRNETMLVEGVPDVVAAFVTKGLAESKGTAHMVKIAREAGAMVVVSQLLR